MLNGPERKSTQREKFVLFVLFSVRGKSRPTETQLVHRGTKTNRVGGVKLISEYLQLIIHGEVDRLTGKRLKVNYA